MIDVMCTLTHVHACPAKPGRVVGPVIPYENGRNSKDAYDGRGYLSNAVLPVQSTISPNCYFRTGTEKNQDKNGITAAAVGDKESSQAKLQQNHHQLPMVAKSTRVVTTDMNNHNHMYYQSHAKAVQLNSQIAMDAKLLQAQSQFGAAAVAVAAHREVGALQYGLS